METISAVESVKLKDLDTKKTYQLCSECGNLRETDELSLDLETDLGTCMTCIGPYRA